MTDPAERQIPAPASAAPAKPERRSGHPLAWLLGLALLALVILVGASPYWAPALAPSLPWGRAASGDSALAARLAADEQQLDALRALNDRVTALERRPVPDSTAAIAAIEDSVQQMGARLDQDEARLAQMAKDEAARGDSAPRILMVALASLGNAVASSQPYEAQLASVEALGQKRAGWAAALQPLEDSAKTGLPSTAILARRFSDEVAPAILRAAASAPGPQASIGDAVLAKLRSLVIIRRVDGSGASDPVDAAVATAETALAKGDLAGAAGAIGTLNGAPAEAAAPWLNDAKHRLQAEATIAKLTQQLASDLAAGANGG